MLKSHIQILSAVIVGLSCVAQVQCPRGLGQETPPSEPPKLLKGGFVQQLRALSEEAIGTMQASEKPNAPVLRPPRVNRPPQPSGRAILRRTHQSPWIERFQMENAQPDTRARQPGATSFSLSDSPAPNGSDENAGQYRMRSQPGRGAADRYQAAQLTQPQTPKLQVPQPQSPSAGPSDQVRTTALRQQVAERQPTQQLKPNHQPEVHVKQDLPPAVWDAIGRTVQELEEGDSQRNFNSDVTTEDIFPATQGTAEDGIAGGIANDNGSANRRPRVSRIPLPGRASQADSPLTSEQSTGSPLPKAVASTLEPDDAESARDSLSESSKPNMTVRSERSPSSVQVPTRMVSVPTSESKLISQQEDQARVAEGGDRQPELLDSATMSLSTSGRLEDKNAPAAGSALKDTTTTETKPELSSQSSGLPDLPSLPSLDGTATLSDSAHTSDSQAVPSQPTGPQVLQRSSVPTDSVAGRGEQAISDQSLRSQTASNATSDDERLRMETPHLEVLLLGSADIPVEKPEEYRVVVVNNDNIDLGGLVLRLDVPTGVETQSLKPSHGDVMQEKAPDGAMLYTWAFENLAKGQRAEAPFRMLAKQPRNFAIAMDWTVMPISGSTDVDVLAPRLEMALEGPAEVRFGEPNTYRLHIRNPGTAPAENVAVELQAGPYGSSSSEIGAIAAGREEIVDVELTFNEQGAIAISANATAAGNLTSKTGIQVLVQRPKLVASVVAPPMVYHGNAVDYRVTVLNDGTAPAENVVATVKLPSGATVINAPDNCQVSSGIIEMSAGELASGTHRDFVFQLQLPAEGENVVAVDCLAEGEITAKASAATLVEAIADLKLTVNDPSAPAPIGSEVTYEVVLKNRGSKAATNVRVVAQFSEGIEPVRGEGQEYEVVPGQLFFSTIPTIEAGESRTLRVVALAETDGTHRFRAEVRTVDSEQRLVHEESTQYLDMTHRMATPGRDAIIR